MLLSVLPADLELGSGSVVPRWACSAVRCLHGTDRGGPAAYRSHRDRRQAAIRRPSGVTIPSCCRYQNLDADRYVQACCVPCCDQIACAGDKNETAINIGFSCRLLNENMLPLIELTSGSAEDLNKELDKALTAMETGRLEAKQQRQYGLVMESRAMAVIFDPKHEELQAKMVRVALQSDAVLGCRCSPMQKAEMVETIQKNVDCVSLAIGDGANDVSMLQVSECDSCGCC